MTNKPSIESLTAMFGAIMMEVRYRLHNPKLDAYETPLRAALSELAAYREDARAAAGECLVPIPEPGTDLSRLLIANHALRAENEALKEENRFALRAGHEFKAERDSAIRQAKAVGDALMAVSAERDAERSRSDALAARVEIWRAFLNSTPVADLSARDARIRREEREAAAVKVDELAALVRLLVHSIRKHSPDNETARRAMDYLKRHELQGSPLRGLSPAPDAAKPNNQQDQP